VHELAELFAQVDLLDAATPGGDGHRPGAVLTPVGGHDTEVVEPQ
jgi:hypothetical protein